jgi:hypothetical protein
MVGTARRRSPAAGRLAERARVLASFGADPAAVDELLAYGADGLEQAVLPAGLRFPLDDEPFVAVWREYRDRAAAIGIAALEDPLVQLRFPVREGIAGSEEYRAATRRGAPTTGMTSATGLGLARPQDCAVTIRSTWAGSIPVIVAGEREDFERLVRALIGRNEPVAVPPSQGAVMVAGYNNWDRVRRFQKRWDDENPGQPFSLAVIAQRRDEYQDRFIVLSSGWYSDVPPRALGLDDDEWRRLSLVIRLEHECAHYWTRRVLSSMRNRMLDEIIADYCGIHAACGRLRADWLEAFLGAGSERGGGRLRNYRGEPPLSDAAFAVLERLVAGAIENLEAFDRSHAEVLAGERGRLLILLTLSRLSLEEIAGGEAQALLDEALRVAGEIAGTATMSATTTNRRRRRGEEPAPC